MYRDDDEAARALADQLRRENAQLEDEKAELSNEKAELADDNAALRRENQRLKAALADRAPNREASRRARRRDRARTDHARTDEAARDPSPPPWPSSWRGGPLAGRIAMMVVAGALAAATTYLAYPLFHGGEGRISATVMSALLGQLWGQLLLAQAVLGWIPDGKLRKPLSPAKRVGVFALGLLALVVSGVFCAFTGEAHPD